MQTQTTNRVVKQTTRNVTIDVEQSLESNITITGAQDSEGAKELQEFLPNHHPVSSGIGQGQ